MNLVLCRESLLEPLEVGGMKQHLTYIDHSHCEHGETIGTWSWPAPGSTKNSYRVVIYGDEKNTCSLWNIFPVI